MWWMLNRELVWRCAKGGTGILLRIRAEVFVGNAGISSNTL
jgi:hypothetical protein